MRELSQAMNNFVVKMAVNQADAVDPEFLIKYINRVAQLTDQSFMLPKDLEKELFSLIKKKISDPRFPEEAF